MSATRLSPLDASFLAVESPTAHMHVGWAATFSPPADRPRPDFDELFEHVRGRLSRDAAVPAAPGADAAARERAPVDRRRHFDAERHIVAATSSTLGEVVDDCMSRQLERDRPLWQLCIADRLDDGRIGVIGKAHHCMVDGIAAVELASLLLDPTPEPMPPRRTAGSPRRSPTRSARSLEGSWSRCARTRTAAAPARALRSPGLRAASRGGRGPRRARGARHAAPRDAGAPAERAALSDRHLAGTRRPLDGPAAGQDAPSTRRSTTSMLAVATGAVRRLFEQRGEAPVPLKAMVPVNVRSRRRGRQSGNRISFMFVDLPCDEPDPPGGCGPSMPRRRDASARASPRAPARRSRRSATLPQHRPRRRLARGREPAGVQPHGLEHPGPAASRCTCSAASSRRPIRWCRSPTATRCRSGSRRSGTRPASASTPIASRSPTPTCSPSAIDESVGRAAGAGSSLTRSEIATTPTRARSCSPAPPGSSGWRSWPATWSARTAASTRWSAPGRGRGGRAPARHVSCLFGDADAYADRLVALPADIERRGAGPRWGATRDRLATQVTDIVHSAASVSFTLPLEESREINVERHPPDARARRAVPRARAASSGSRTCRPRTWPGPTRASSARTSSTSDSEFRNPYEQSKFEAERLVRAQDGRLPIQIFRPSIVVGERTTGWTPAFNVLYSPLKAFVRGSLPALPGAPLGAGRRRAGRLRRRRGVRAGAGPRRTGPAPTTWSPGRGRRPSGA